MTGMGEVDWWADLVFNDGLVARTLATKDPNCVGLMTAKLERVRAMRDLCNAILIMRGGSEEEAGGDG